MTPTSLSLQNRIAELEAELGRLRAQGEERERELELHRKIVQHTPVGLLLARLEEPGNPGSFRFLWGNDAAFEASYVPREQVEGARLDVDMPAIIEAGLADLYYRALQTGEVQDGPSFAYHAPEGLPAFFDVRVGRISEDTVVIYYSDVTVRQRQLEDLQASNAALVKSNEELERFAAVVSHDLQAPLRNIQGFLRLLSEEETEADGDAQMYVSGALTAAQRLDATVNGLLDIARIGTTKRREPVELQVMLSELRHDLGLSEHDSSGTLVVEELPVVSGDPGQLRQLFQNLLTNAVRYRRLQVPLHIEVRAEERGDCWHFAVSDNGIGVAPQYAERIFEFFQRLHREDEIEGLGLGLSICKRVVEEHGGSLWLEQTAQPGATFCFTLPTRAALARAGRFDDEVTQRAS